MIDRGRRETSKVTRCLESARLDQVAYLAGHLLLSAYALPSFAFCTHPGIRSVENVQGADSTEAAVFCD